MAASFFCIISIIIFRANSQNIIAKNGTITMNVNGASLILSSEGYGESAGLSDSFATETDLTNLISVIQPQVFSRVKNKNIVIRLRYVAL